MALRSFTWQVQAGASQQTTLKTNVVSFGEYEQVSTSGINNALVNAQYSVQDRQPVIDAAYQFLLDHKGSMPFLMTVAGETKTFRTEGQINKNHVSYNVWQLSFTVKQVFIP